MNSKVSCNTYISIISISAFRNRLIWLFAFSSYPSLHMYHYMLIGILSFLCAEFVEGNTNWLKHGARGSFRYAPRALTPSCLQCHNIMYIVLKFILWHELIGFNTTHRTFASKVPKRAVTNRAFYKFLHCFVGHVYNNAFVTSSWFRCN